MIVTVKLPRIGKKEQMYTVFRTDTCVKIIKLDIFILDLYRQRDILKSVMI